MSSARIVLVLLVAFLTLQSLSCGPTGGSQSLALVPTVQRSEYTPETPIDSMLARMSIEEKVGQLVMVRANGVYVSADNAEYRRLLHLVTERHVGGVIMVQGDVYEVALLLNRLQQAARIPLLVASDLERGTAMRIRRTTYFGDAMAIGATGNPRYAYLAGKATAMEARAIGIQQNYAPVADINSNPDNPVINTRSFGDDLPLVRQMVGAYVRGMVDGGGMPTAKHFPGHGDTETDSHLALPVLPYSRQHLDSIELAPFRTAIDSGVTSVMIGHIAAPALDSGAVRPASVSPLVIDALLRSQMKFHGLVVTDAMDMQGIRGYSVASSVVLAVQAGVDIVLMTADEDVALDALLGAVRSGEISEARLDLSVRRILAAKRQLGLDRQQVVNIDQIPERVATAEHLQLAEKIARDAITLVRNEENVVPLRVPARKRIVILSISDTDDNRTEIMRSTNPFPNEPFSAFFVQQVRDRHPHLDVIRLTPTSNELDFAEAAKRLKNAHLVLVPLYVKVRTSTGRIGIPENINAWLGKERWKAPTVVVALGNPYLIKDFPYAKALMCAYGDAEPEVAAAVEALFGEIPIRGKLPVSIAGIGNAREGINLGQSSLREDKPSTVGFDLKRLSQLDLVIRNAIQDSAFPGAELAVVKDGVTVYDKCFGSYTYDHASGAVERSTMYDLASVTKVLATTPAVMKLVDEGRLSLDDKVGKYLPQFTSGEKARITVRDLMLHRGGFPPFRQLWKFVPSPAAAVDTVLNTPLIAHPGDTTIYSDLGMITMGKIVERITGMRLDTFVTQTFYEPLGMRHTMFLPPAALWPSIAPTEMDTSWRKALVRGTVHDENAQYLGGVSGHAGLFSTASDLCIFMQMLMNRGTYGGERFLKESTIDMFLRERRPGQERWIGWDMKSPTGSSAGELFSGNSFGHIGFTGTSIWADPVRKLFVVLLTNRVYPTRVNYKLFRVRPLVHDTVVKALEERQTVGL